MLESFIQIFGMEGKYISKNLAIFEINQLMPN